MIRIAQWDTTSLFENLIQFAEIDFELGSLAPFHSRNEYGTQLNNVHVFCFVAGSHCRAAPHAAPLGRGFRFGIPRRQQ